MVFRLRPQLGHGRGCRLRPVRPTVTPRDPVGAVCAVAVTAQKLIADMKTIIHYSATFKILQPRIVKYVAEEARIYGISSLIKIQRPGARLGRERGTVLYLGCHACRFSFGKKLTTTAIFGPPPSSTLIPNEENCSGRRRRSRLQYFGRNHLSGRNLLQAVF